MDQDILRYIQFGNHSPFRPEIFVPSVFEGTVQVDPSHREPEAASDKKGKKTPDAPPVTWDDIGGQEEAKRQMKEAIELPFTHKEIFSHYGVKPPKGILLYGPPGCGKTMFGKAAASCLAAIHNRPVKDGAFVYVKAPEIRERYVGESERKIRKLFEDAQKYKEKHGFPSVIFIDEADATLPNRARSTRFESSVVASFLTEMDGMEESGAIVILATNRPESIDPAIVRDGRIDRKIRIDRPGPKECESILRMNLKNVPLKDVTQNRLIRVMTREFFSPHRTLFNVRTDQGVHALTLGHVVNGAMIVGAVSQAASLALHRDLAANERTGVRLADAVKAIDAIQRQQFDLDHSDAAKDLAETLSGKVIRIEKARPQAKEAVQCETAEEIAEGPDNIFDEAA
jgi:SpoVK/Ycf46/Vps4 family AAA+-type ATPase